FYTSALYRNRIKGPVEYAIGLLRILEVPRANVNLLATASACCRQGQALYEPPSVKGWEGGTSWINSGTLLQRQNWATDVLWGNPEYGVRAYAPGAWAEKRGLAPGEAAAALTSLLLQDDLPAESRVTVLAAGRDGSPEALRKALQLLLHSPEFQ